MSFPLHTSASPLGLWWWVSELRSTWCTPPDHTWVLHGQLVGLGPRFPGCLRAWDCCAMARCSHTPNKWTYVAVPSNQGGGELPSCRLWCRTPRGQLSHTKGAFPFLSSICRSTKPKRAEAPEPNCRHAPAPEPFYTRRTGVMLQSGRKKKIFSDSPIVFVLFTELYISCMLYTEQSDCGDICIQRAGNRLPTTFSGYQHDKQTYRAHQVVSVPALG